MNGTDDTCGGNGGGGDGSGGGGGRIDVECCLGRFSGAAVKLARSRAAQIGPLHGSLSSRATAVGCLGEDLFHKYMKDVHGIQLIAAPGCLNYDFIAPANGLRVEAKTTERRLDWLSNNVLMKQQDQQCDLYVFIHVEWLTQDVEGRFYFCGCVTKRHFATSRAVHAAGTLREGTKLVPAASYGYVARSACGGVDELIYRCLAPVASQPDAPAPTRRAVHRSRVVTKMLRRLSCTFALPIVPTNMAAN